MDQGLAGKRVLVTGGSKGIGRATVLAFARAGAQVLTCYGSDGAAADELAGELKELGDQHRVIRADVTTVDGAQTLANTARELFGGLDVVVNNVGVDGIVAFEDLNPAEWTRVMDHNVNSVYLVTHAAMPLIADNASIVIVSSSVALRGRARGVHYTASKAAQLGFMRALCKELGPRGIRVNAVSPGLTETEPGAGVPPIVLERVLEMTPLGRLAQPEDVANAVLYLAGDTAVHITGATLNIDGGA